MDSSQYKKKTIRLKFVWNTISCLPVAELVLWYEGKRIDAVADNFWSFVLLNQLLPAYKSV